MIFRSGLTSVVSDTYIAPPNQLQPAPLPAITALLQDSPLSLNYAIVTDIILDNSNLELFDNNGKLAGIGTVFFNGGEKAQPLFPNIKIYPMVGETVILIKGLVDQQPVLGDNKTLPSVPRNYYITTVNFFSNPHYNPTPSSNSKIFANVDLQPFLNQNINPLLPFAGDVIHEGRFGNSIRLGNTSKTKSPLSNTWQSDSGENGDPITIVRNGQNPQIQNPFIPITEDISNDLSSIYLTSTQRLKNFRVASELYNSYITPPVAPSLFTSPQAAINSDRIVINAKTDSVLLSAQKSIGMSTNGNINIDVTSHYISSNDIKLGSKNATQPVLLGDDTVELLKQLTGAIKDLASILQVQRDYPGGNLATSYNAIAGNVLEQINNPSNGILAQLNNNSLKSKTTKVQ